MYEHLLVGLDGSLTAERVLEHAEALATAFGSTITLLRATMAPETLVAETSGAGQSVGDLGTMIDPMPILEADRRGVVDYLDGVAARLRHHHVEVRLEHPEGPAADAIVERASALDISLILLTTHGRSGFGRMVFGSVADAVLRHAPCPVLLVRVSDDDRRAEVEPTAEA